MSELLRLLQVEDSESDAALIVRLLERAGYEVRAARVEEAAEMRGALASERWDAIIADHKMAQFDAPGALRVLHEAGLDIPFIVVSGSIGEELAVSLMKSGAHDYLLKQNLARLAPAVEREVREARLREERRRLGEQFRQAQKLESIGRLAGAVAHDFNNLLTVITGYSQMMMAELPLRHPFREQVEEISKAANRAADLTRQLLAFSRRQPAELHALRLNDHVRDVQKMLTRLIGEDINLSVSLKADPGVIRADTGQLEQVLMNLAVNAKDAMPNGGKLIIETSDLLVDERFSRTHLSVEPRPLCAAHRYRQWRRHGREREGAAFRTVLHNKRKG
jgi:signal transduction histidine kinase